MCIDTFQALAWGNSYSGMVPLSLVVGALGEDRRRRCLSQRDTLCLGRSVGNGGKGSGIGSFTLATPASMHSFLAVQPAVGRWSEPEHHVPLPPPRHPETSLGPLSCRTCRPILAIDRVQCIVDGNTWLGWNFRNWWNGSSSRKGGKELSERRSLVGSGETFNLNGNVGAHLGCRAFLPAKTPADSKLRKLGHLQIQKGPQRVKRGKYRRRYWPNRPRWL